MHVSTLSIDIKLECVDVRTNAYLTFNCTYLAIIRSNSPGPNLSILTRCDKSRFGPEKLRVAQIHTLNVAVDFKIEIEILWNVGKHVQLTLLRTVVINFKHFFDPHLREVFLVESHIFFRPICVYIEVLKLGCLSFCEYLVESIQVIVSKRGLNGVLEVGIV